MFPSHGDSEHHLGNHYVHPWPRLEDVGHIVETGPLKKDSRIPLFSVKQRQTKHGFYEKSLQKLSLVSLISNHMPCPNPIWKVMRNLTS